MTNNRVGQNVAKTKHSRIFVQRLVGSDQWTDIETMGWETKEDAERWMPNHVARYGQDTKFRYVERTVVTTDKLV